MRDVHAAAAATSASFCRAIRLLRTLRSFAVGASAPLSTRALMDMLR